MTTMADLLSTYTTQAEMDNFFTSNLSIYNVKSYGAQGDGSTDDTVAIQDATDAAETAGGGIVFYPESTYLISSTITTYAYIHHLGTGVNSVVFSDLDIELFKTPGVAATNYTDIIFQKMRFYKTAESSTKYHLLMTNTRYCKIIDCDVLRTVVNESSPVAAPNNIGGIYFQNNSSTSTYMNQVINSILRNSSINIETTDSKVEGCYVWSFANDFAIKVSANNVTIINTDLIPSPTYGGIYVKGFTATSVVEHLKVIGCFIDGNLTLTSGDGIYAPSYTAYGGMRGIIIIGNSFWNCSKHAIYAIDPGSCVIANNYFNNNNKGDNSYSDIELAAQYVDPKYNVVSENTHRIDSVVARANKGCAYKETDLSGGVYTFQDNKYIDNTISTLAAAPSYNNPSISISRTTFATCTRLHGTKGYGATLKARSNSTISTGTSTKTINHGLSITPLGGEIAVTLRNAPIAFSLSDPTATQFTVSTDGNVAVDTNIWWMAEIS